LPCILLVLCVSALTLRFPRCRLFPSLKYLMSRSPPTPQSLCHHFPLLSALCSGCQPPCAGLFLKVLTNTDISHGNGPVTTELTFRETNAAPHCQLPFKQMFDCRGDLQQLLVWRNEYHCLESMFSSSSLFFFLPDELFFLANRNVPGLLFSLQRYLLVLPQKSQPRGDSQNHLDVTRNCNKVHQDSNWGKSAPEAPPHFTPCLTAQC